MTHTSCTPHRHAFTLIELLVVVTIIVILLALLTPALDRAIYQAELSVCQAQQKGVAGGALSYAFEQKRYYPDRAVLNNGANSQPLMLATEQGTDDRKLIAPYIPFKMLRDPMGDDYPMEVNETAPLSRVHSSYELWFGVRYAGPYGGITPSGMKKLGDRFSWYDDADYTGTRYYVNRFSVLSSDLDFSGFDRGVIFNGHPDSLGKLSLDTQRTTPGGASPLAGTPAQAAKENYSRWRTGSPDRGLTDSNYAYDDGSVLRLTGLTLDYDDRLAAVPYQTNNQNWSHYAVHIPRQ